MATLVTGSSGFVCVNVVRMLAASGERVVAFDLTPADDAVRKFLAAVEDRVAFVTGDVGDQTLVEKVFAEHGVDSVIHGAVITSNTREVDKAQPARIASVNLGGTISVLEAARKAAVRRFVYISSRAVYGNQGSNTEALDESVPPRPTGLYGITKLAAEQTTLYWHDLHGMDTVAVRLSSPVGPMERPTHARLSPSLVYSWAIAALGGEKPVVPHLDAVRDWTYIDDIAAGILAACRAPTLGHRLFNLSLGIQYTASDLVQAIQAVIPSFRVEVSPERGSYPGTYPDLRGPLDSTRARAELGFAPRYDLPSGVARYLRWLLDGSPTPPE